MRVRTADQGEPFLLRVIYVLRLFSPSKDGAVVDDLQKQRHLLTKNKNQFFFESCPEFYETQDFERDSKRVAYSEAKRVAPAGRGFTWAAGLPPQARLIPNSRFPGISAGHGLAFLNRNKFQKTAQVSIKKKGIDF